MGAAPNVKGGKYWNPQTGQYDLDQPVPGFSAYNSPSPTWQQAAATPGPTPGLIGGGTSNGASSAPATPPRPVGGTVPYATQTPGFNGNTSNFGQPSIFGTGMFQPNQFPINDQAITGSPTQGGASNYGLNDVYGALEKATNALGVKDYSATAPQFAAAQGTGATGAAAQGQAALGQAAQGTASGYSAALGNASTVGQVAGQAALGNASLARAAQMQAAQGGYAATGGTRLSTAGDAAFQSQQQQLANILSAQAQGQGTSPADLQLQQGAQQSLANTLAALGSQRGSSNFALAQRTAADQGAAAVQNLNQQLGIQRAQETLNAQNALGSVLGTARGQAQATNQAQANLTQQSNLANLANAQAATMQNAGFNQQAAETNAANQQQTNLANQGSQNNLTLANLAAQNAQIQQNASLAQQANEFNAGSTQAMTLANLLAQNQASQFNAGNAQQMTLANLAAQNAMTGQNLGALNTMAGANLAAQNQFGLENVSNAQQMGLANLSNQQQQNLANESLLGQYGLANQSAAENAQNQYNQMLLSLLGAQTGIGEANRSAQLADQQLQVQQNTAANQIAAQSYAAAAAQNSNLTGSIMSGVSALIAQLTNAAKGASDSSSGSAADSGQGGTSADDNNAAGNGAFNADPNNPSGANYTPPPDGGGDTSGGGDLGGGGDVSAASFQYQQGPNGKYYDPQTGQYDLNAPFALSDENVKTGIEGGNPMLQSFLEQMRGSEDKPANIDVDAGLNFRDPTYIKTAKGGGGGGGFGLGGILGAIGGLVGSAVAPGIGTAIGGALGSAAGNAVSGAAGGGGGGGVETQLSNPGSGLESIGVTDDDATALSDDQAKENVLSGNRGMQAFLEQANAQTAAQNGQGAQSNAFMQTGQAPRAQVDRQMPPSMVNAGYGAAQPVSLPELLGGGYGGGVSARGGASPGGFASLGGYQGGGYQGGGIASMGGGYQGGIFDNAGITTTGGVAVGPSFTPGALAMPGGEELGYQPGLTSQGVGSPFGRSTVSASGARALNPQMTRPPGANAVPAPGPSGLAGLLSGGAGGSGVGQGQVPPWVLSPPTSGSSPFNGSALSDEDEKKDVAPSRDEVDQMLDQLHAYSYRYKNPTAPGAAPGRRIGVMAQDLERSPLGASFVEDTPGGKRVNYGQAAGTMMAGLAYHNERLDQHEQLLREILAHKAA